MDNTTNIERLIDAAAKYGYTEEQIMLICDEIGQATYEQFVQEAERLFTPDEKHMLEGLQDEEKERSEVARLYKEKTGRDAQETINGYLSRHVDEFIQDHHGSTQQSV